MRLGIGATRQHLDAIKVHAFESSASEGLWTQKFHTRYGPQRVNYCREWTQFSRPKTHPNQFQNLSAFHRNNTTKRLTGDVDPYSGSSRDRWSCSHLSYPLSIPLCLWCSVVMNCTLIYVLYRRPCEDGISLQEQCHDPE